MRNYDSLLSKIVGWLTVDGKLFVHIFCHKQLAYPFETEGDDNWMGRYFFTGGLMPSRDTLLHFQNDLQLQYQWDMSGSHYQKTAEAWLANMDQHRHEIRAVFINTYGKKRQVFGSNAGTFFYCMCRIVWL